MKSSEQINELATALAAAQGEMENASKSSENPHFRSKYADLAEVINCVRPVFSKHGLSFTQLVGYEQGIVSVETVLMHKSGQWVSGTISAPVSKQDAQGVGSATTYCRRYGLAGMAGLAQEDDDANAAVGGNGKAKPNGNGKQPEAPPDPNRERYKIIAAELDGALSVEDVNGIMANRKAWIDAMPEKGRIALNDMAMAKLSEFDQPF